MILILSLTTFEWVLSAKLIQVLYQLHVLVKQMESICDSVNDEYRAKHRMYRMIRYIDGMNPNNDRILDA